MTTVVCRNSQTIAEDALLELHDRLLRVRFMDGTFSGRTKELRDKRARAFALVESVILVGDTLGYHANMCRAGIVAFNCEV